MRNLKRALSLTLASVMLLGMMVVGSSATGFPDVTEEDNVEAIEVLRAVEVMIGDDNGNFGPNDPVNRSQMAVVMAKLLNLDYQYYESSCIFWDVPTWARGYVGACYAKGIVSGYGGTTYGAADTVTAVQAASMMMRALGYFQHAEDYKGSFELATVSQGTEIGIFDGVGSSATAPMTRNQVARMALNALESEMVTFTGTPGVTIGDATVGYRAEYTPRTSTELKYKAIEDRTSDASMDSNHRGQYYIQLGEELYNGKLTKKYARDDFERPSINWQYDGKEIGTYVDYELKEGEYTEEVKGSELYDLLTYTTIRDYDLYSYVDGVENDIKKDDLVRSNKNGVKHSGKGVLTEVFVDQERDEIIITSINTYLAKANSDYNKTNESLSLKVYTGIGSGKVASTTQVVDSAEVEEAEGVAKDDFVLVYMSGKEKANGIGNYPNYSVVKMFDVEVLSNSAVTKFSTSTGKVVDKLTTGGTEYGTNVMAYYDFGNALNTYDAQLLTDMTYNIFLDRYGNAIGVELDEGTKNYVFITGYDRVASHISVKTAQAAAIFLDGTMDEITVNVTETNKKIDAVDQVNANYVQWGANGTAGGVRDLNRWYTYTVANNGNYILKPVEHFMYSSASETGIVTAPNKDLGEVTNASPKTLNIANLYLDDSRPSNGTAYVNQGRAYGNDDTVYITVEPGIVDWSNGNDHDAIVDVKGMYAGIQNVKIELKPDYKEKVNDRKDPSTGTYDESEKNAYVYSVYDSNYYIIACVVLGEAQGAAANYAYILGDVKSERVEFESNSAKATGDATYYWEFDAFYKGEKVTLTAKTKYPGNTVLTKHHVQELRFDGDYVTSVKDVTDGKVVKENNVKISGQNVYDVGHVTTADATGYQVHTHNGVHSVPAEYDYSSHRLNGTIELVGRTLYTEREKVVGGVLVDNYDVGLALRSNDTPALLIQPENGKVESTVCSSVSEAIGRLADADNDGTNGKQFKGRIVAALKDDAAEWVVIISDTNLTTGNRPNWGDGNHYLDLYHDLSNTNYENPTTVTASNRKGDDVVIKGYIYRDADYGVCTRYVIPAGYSTVVIQDRDIDTIFEANYVILPDVMAEFINLRNSTLTIPEMDRDVRISSRADAFAGAAATVSVTGATEGVTTSTITGLKVGDTFTVTPVNDDYTFTVTGASLVSGNTYKITSTSVVINVTKIDDGKEETLTVKLGASSEDDTAAQKVTATVKNGKVTVTGLDAGKLLKAFVVKDGVKLAETTKDSETMNWTDGAELWVLKGKMTGYLDPDSGLLITENTWPESEAGIESMARMARAAREGKAFKFVTRYESYATINIGGQVFDIEKVTVLFEGEEAAKEAYKFLKKDIAKANEAFKDVDLSEGLPIDPDWTKDTVPVELPGSAEIVMIPVDKDGEMVLNVEYTAGTDKDENNANIVIKAKPGDENVYKIGDEIVTEEGLTPTKGSDVEVVDKNDPALTGLEFTLTAEEGAKFLNGSSGTKAEAIQKDVGVTFDKDKNAFTVTGDLVFQKGLTEWSNTSTDGYNAGYFVALHMDWSEAAAGTQIRLTTFNTDSGKEELKDTDIASGKTADTILIKVAKQDGTMVGNPQIQVYNKITNTTKNYRIDLSGLNVPAPELIQFTTVEKQIDGDKLGSKGIDDIQTGVKVDVTETSSTERTVKLTGTLHPVTDIWTDYWNDATYGKGYFVGIYMDASATTGVKVNRYSPNAGDVALKEYTGDALTQKNIMYLRVADLATGTQQAETKGNVVFYAVNGGKQVTYTLDLSGLILEKVGSGDVAVKPMTGKLPAAFGEMPAANFQKNLSVELRNGTIYVSGELTPIKWTTGWPETMQKGYYVWFDIDASGVTGAKAWSVRGNAGGNAVQAHDDFVFFLGGADLKKDDIKQHTLYVLNAKMEDQSTPDKAKTLKTYTLDFSGVTLLEDEPFTVTAVSDKVAEANVHQSLLCDMGTYDVTVDHESKKIVVTGDLYLIDDVNTPWAYSELKTVMGEAYSQGYFVTFQVVQSTLADDFKFKTEGVNQVNNGQDTNGTDGVIVRVAELGKSDVAAGRLLLKTGENKYETYEFDLSGVNFMQTKDRVEPTKPANADT